VLLDLHMPGMQGGEVLYRLRSRPSTEHVPVVIVSGSTQLTHMADPSQVDGFLEKPFDLEQLVTVIEGLCPQQKTGIDYSQTADGQS
jgi:CheY-like chemotaxis protein